MERVMLTAYVKPEVKDRIPELLSFFKTSTISKLIERVLEDSIEWMDSKKGI